jgi:hypothetical protein
MTDLNVAPGGAAELSAVPVPANEGPISLRDAGRALSDYRFELRKKDTDEAPEAPEEGGTPSEPERNHNNESSDAATSTKPPNLRKALGAAAAVVGRCTSDRRAW